MYDYSVHLRGIYLFATGQLSAGFWVSRQVRILVLYKGVELRKDFSADGERSGRGFILLQIES